jgi:hypothetical protein
MVGASLQDLLASVQSSAAIAVRPLSPLSWDLVNDRQKQTFAVLSVE